MNHSDPRKRRRGGAYAAVLSATLAAAMIPVAPAFADPTDDAVGAAAISGGGLEKLADYDVYNYFDAHDGSLAATQAVETLNADLSDLSKPAATWLEEFTILVYGGGLDVTPPDLAALLP
jgi:hypothetical protein